MICPPWRESPDPEGLRAAIERIVRQELDDSLPLTTARIELLLVVTQRLGLPALLAVIPPLDPAFSELKRAAMRKDEGPWLAYIVRALAAGGAGGVRQMNP